MKAVTVAALVFLSGLAARAEMSAITVAASVISVGENTVKVRIDKKEVVVPKSLVSERELKAGDAILVTFRGDQIKYLLPEGAENRQPASENPKKKKKKN